MVSGHENAAVKKRDYGNPMAVSLFLIGLPHNLRTYEAPRCRRHRPPADGFRRPGSRESSSRVATRLGGCHLPGDTGTGSLVYRGTLAPAARTRVRPCNGYNLLSVARLDAIFFSFREAAAREDNRRCTLTLQNEKQGDVPDEKIDPSFSSRHTRIFIACRCAAIYIIKIYANGYEIARQRTTRIPGSRAQFLPTHRLTHFNDHADALSAHREFQHPRR